MKENENFDLKTVGEGNEKLLNNYSKKRCNNSQILKKGKFGRTISEYVVNESSIKNVKIVMYTSKPNRVITR